MTGALIYVVGASGSGKDSLLRHARACLGGDPGIVFAHRYITRPHDAGGENHVALTAEEFAARRADRLFALHWQGHGLEYGIGIEINQWLAKGLTVIVNGSRAYLPDVRSRYPELVPVWIEVSPATLRQRLSKRGRETAEEIERRLARHRALPGATAGDTVIRNDGALEQAGEALVRVIRRHSRATACG